MTTGERAGRFSPDSFKTIFMSQYCERCGRSFLGRFDLCGQCMDEVYPDDEDEDVIQQCYECGGCYGSHESFCPSKNINNDTDNTRTTD